jgi:lipopolysaccharide export system protein LptA
MTGPRRLRSLALCALLACAAPVPLAAQDLTGLQGGKGPLEINADQGIEWQRNRNRYIARGNARAARGNVVVHADVLTAHYRTGKSGGSEVYRIDANGHVRIVSQSETIYADDGVYNVDKGLMLLHGKDLRLEAGEDQVRARDSLEYWENERAAVARGNAVAVRGDRQVKGDVLTAYFKPDADNRLEISTVTADGNVEISSPTEFASGDGGVYYVKQDLATLTGAVKVTRGENQLNGEYAEVNLATGVSRLLGAPPGQSGDTRVRGLLVPGSGKDGGSGS